MAAKLESVRLMKQVDEQPDLSWIGSYASTYGGSDIVVDRQERGHADSRQHRYFIWANQSNYKEPLKPRERRELEQDYRRMEDYGNGWVMVGVWAEADIVVDGVIQKLRSGGLWGIESDSDQAYFNSVGQEEYNALKDILKEMGVKGKLPKFDDLDWRER